MPSLRASLIAIGVAAVAGASCSLINQFDPVKQGQGGAGSGTGTGGHASTSSSGSGGGNAGPGGAGGSTATSGGGGSTLTTGSGGGGGSGEPVGLIVATGNSGANRVFATIDPATGNLLNSYALNVAVVLYDENTDLWYVFTGDAVPPLPGSTVTLHVGTIDPKTGAWSESHMLSPVPVLRDYQNFAVLNHRIVYKAYDPDSDAGFGSPIGLAIIDTTNPTPKLGGTRGFVQVADFFGLIGTRAAGDGGTVNLISQSCTGTYPTGTCQVQRTQVSFPLDPSSDPGIIGTTDAAVIPAAPNMFSISAAWASWVRGGPDDLLVYPPAQAQSDGTIQPYNPTSSQTIAPVTFAASGSNQFYAAAIAECEGYALVTEQVNKTLYAVSLTDGTTTSIGTNNPAQIIAYEPITKTVVVPLHIPNVAIVGYTLDVSGGTPTLTQRSWNTPTSLNADNVTIRRLKQPISCPP